MPTLSTLPAQSPDDFAQHLRRLGKMRRLVNALSVSIDEIEREMLALHAPQSDGERAAQAARMATYQTGPSEVKVIHD